MTRHDVLVVGGGNAGLCAAAAAQAAGRPGLRVGVLEKAPRAERGGNSALTGHMRFVCESFADLLVLTPYQPGSPEAAALADRFAPRTTEDYWNETMAVTDGHADPDQLAVLVRNSYPTMRWLSELGMRWVISAGSTTDNTAQLAGGGRQLQEHNYDMLERAGVDIRYGAAATRLFTGRDGGVTGVEVLTEQGVARYDAGCVVLASGGFESSPQMRAAYLGRGWDTVRMRGVPYNTGEGLRMAVDIGAATAGSWTSCHASPQDVARPAFGLPSAANGGGTEWDRYLYPFGIMVNRDGVRFTDEGADVRSRTYARMGREILAQPGGVAYQILDAKVRRAGLVDGRYDRGTGAKADNLADLATRLGIGPALVDTVASYNAALCDGSTTVAPVTARDGRGTRELWPAKSNFAVPIDEPPFEGYAVCCGITFTFGGLAVDPETAQVKHVSGGVVPGLFAAGEIVGGLWHGNYAGGSGMAAGSVFGKIAGEHAVAAAVDRAA
jgi:tricarballylate dehydrogenase